jgi:hypothetical protein
MPPSIPTYRPLMTATRSAVLIAVVAAGSSVLLAVDGAYSRMATPAIASVQRWDCNDTAGAGKPRDVATHAADRRSAVQ